MVLFIATVLLAVPGPAIISSLLSASKVGRLIPQDTYPSLLINFLLYEAMRKIVSIHAIGNACLMSASRVQDFLLLDDIQIVATNAATARAAGNTVGRNESQVAVAHNSATQLPVNGAILLQNVSICASWTNQGPSLDNVNVHVQQNELVMVAGPTGCGKSTFVRFLVGDGVRRSGVFLKKPGKAGYCDQRPWLQHASIRDNIIGPLKFDEPWYNTVVEACLLPADFKQLTLADGTVVENNNSNLSNGQIHRIVSCIRFKRSKSCLTNQSRPWLELCTCKHPISSLTMFSLHWTLGQRLKFSVDFLVQMALLNASHVL